MNTREQDMRRPATEIVRILRDAGHVAYFAGGWVRDLLLGHPSGDIDIATAAPPEEVMRLFPHTVPVGIAFGVVIVVHRDISFEVTSFRKDGLYLYGRRPETIEFATPQEDAQRRDFTINGIFYDPLQSQIIDFVEGQDDLRKGVVRAIGNAEERIKEDRLRMIRAVRVMARFGFTLEPSTRAAIERYASSLFPAVAVERVWQEFTKMTENPGFAQALVEMHALGLLQAIFPDLQQVSLETVKQRAEPCERLPADTPTILYLAQLFPDGTASEWKRLCEQLKVPNRDAELVAYYQLARRTYRSTSIDQVAWVYLYAHPQAEICLQVYAATLEDFARSDFLALHAQQMRELAVHVERMRENRPLVRAAHLQSEGIAPSKAMGALLKEAERMVIEGDLQVPEEAVQRLKQSTLWPKDKR